jgi:hypothetical protein
MAKHVQMAVRNFQLPAQVPLQHKVSIPRRTVLRGEDESISPVSNVGSEFIHNLKWDGDFPNSVLRLRRLNLAAPHGLTDAKQFSVWVNVTNAKSTQFREPGPFRFLGGCVESACVVCTAWSSDERRARADGPRTNVGDVRGLDRSDRLRRIPAPGAAPAARHRAKHCNHGVGLGESKGVFPRRDINRQTKSNPQR